MAWQRDWQPAKESCPEDSHRAASIQGTPLPSNLAFTLLWLCPLLCQGGWAGEGGWNGMAEMPQRVWVGKSSGLQFLLEQENFSGAFLLTGWHSSAVRWMTLVPRLQIFWDSVGCTLCVWDTPDPPAHRTWDLFLPVFCYHCHLLDK